MKITLLAALAVILSLLSLASAQATREGITPLSSAPLTTQRNQPQKMTITRSGERQSSIGPEANFTGSVRVESLFPVNSPSRASGASVTFEPGARSAWHTHPLGQTLIVTAGIGWVQQEGGEKQAIRPGGCRLDTAGREALARRDADQVYDAHRNQEEVEAWPATA